MDLDLDHLRSWIGRSETMSEPLSPQLVTRFNATVGRDTPAEAGNAAPLMIHFCLAQPVAGLDSLGPDGHPARGGFLPPVPLPRRMWAGGEIDFREPLVIGSVVTRHSTIKNVEIKQGRSGVLCFVTVMHDYSADGRLCVRERQDLVYRDPPNTDGAGPGAPADPALAARIIGLPPLRRRCCSAFPPSPSTAIVSIMMRPMPVRSRGMAGWWCMDRFRQP